MSKPIARFFNGLACDWNQKEPHSQNEIFDFINEHAGLKRGMRVLDLGCGTGIISEPIYKITGKKVTAIDVSDKMIAVAKATRDHIATDFFVADFYNFEHEPFDAIVCFNAFPHFSDIAGFVNKAYSLLKEGGTLSILHNMSRDALNKHHEGIPSEISRYLNGARDEALPFNPKFDLDYIVDDDKIFALRFKRKSDD